MTGGALNLSLLSRGVGEVHTNGHEKVDVYLEPEDYYNFTNHPDRVYLPPIQTNYNDYFDGSPSLSSRTPKEVQQFRVPKTFTTRKGALLLFSEDMAQRNSDGQNRRRTFASSHDQVSGSLDTQMTIRTVDDLAKSILKYGAQDNVNGKVYLKFVRNRGDMYDRQIRPGFSAKRYLSTWTRTWDDTVFDNIVKQGFITGRSLHTNNLMAPNLRKRLFYEDLSHMPQPYRLMKTMLLTPGSLSGYSFYRAPDSHFIEEEYNEDDIIFLRKRSDTQDSIRVVKTKEGVQEEVAYSNLDRDSQKDVITDLLVKSAVHFALKKQEEILQDAILRASGSDFSSSSSKLTSSVTYEFNMKDAVESLLDSQQGRFTIRNDLPNINDKSQNSEPGKSFNSGSNVPRLSKRQNGARTKSGSEFSEGEPEHVIPSVSIKDGSESSSEFSGVPVLPPIRHTLSPIRDMSRETTYQNVLLPSIDQRGMLLDPPAVHVLPATPQHSTLSATALAQGEVTGQNVKPPAVGTDNSASAADNSLNMKLNFKTRNKSKHDFQPSGIIFHPPTLSQPLPRHFLPSLQDSSRSDYSTVSHAPPTCIDSWTFDGEGNAKWHKFKLGGSQSGSLKGSVIMAPDGEIISVGGSVARSSGSSYDVGNINDVISTNRPEAVAGGFSDESDLSDDEPGEWKKDKKMSVPKSESSYKVNKRGSVASSSVSKEELNKLSPAGKYLLWDQASKVTGDSSSQRSSLTEQDIVDTLTDHAQLIADHVLSQPDAGNNLENDVKRAAELWAKSHPADAHAIRAEAVESMMRTKSSSSSASSAAEYRNMITKSLATAAARAAGIDPSSITVEPELSPELLEALVNQTLSPDQFEIVSDSDGKTRVQSRVDLTAAMGGVEPGHLYVSAGSDEEGQRKRHVSIPADKGAVIEDVQSINISQHSVKALPEMEEKADAQDVPTVESNAISQDQPVVPAMFQQKEDPDISSETDNTVTTTQNITEEKVAVKKIEKSSPEEVKKPVEQEKETSPATETKKTETKKTEKKTETVPEVKSTQKPEKAKVKKEKKSATEKEEPFVVGNVDRGKELSMLYGSDLPQANLPIPPPIPPTLKPKGKPKDKKPKEPEVKKEDKKQKKGKKGKKGGKKKEKEPEPLVPEQAPVEEPVAAEQPLPPQEPVEEEKTTLSEVKTLTPELEREETEMEFNFIHDVSPEPEPVEKQEVRASSPAADVEDVSEPETTGGTEESRLKSISNREARAAQRAAAAAKKKEEVERRRREKEEQHKREKEEMERQIALKKEMEEAERRREEERILRKKQQQEAEEREKRAEEEAERRKKLEAEREKKAKEEYQRKLEEMRKKQLEEEMRRHELLLQKQKEEEERIIAEQLMMSKMAEEERLEYERRKREIEEERKRRELEEKLKHEEDARKALEEAQRLAAEMARKQAELEAKLRFNRSLQEESVNLSQAHQINRAFVFSYFELLQWLGLDIPDFEFAKLANY
ncbi:microtubule-associated protein futsch-like [Physella acuta]|uniref:microtubule-associated protein futsch-like n=1 Tax=Physella acuta TaxID=109671 RepID=UPI0027DC7B99|nr:microtubule-associated protein futsch-like [Physella acuta]